MLRPFVHFSALVNFSVCIYLQLRIRFTEEDAERFAHFGIGRFGGPWKFLTFWNLWFQAAFFGLALISDLRGRSKKNGNDLVLCR